MNARLVVIGKTEIEEFIRRAEALNANLASSALRGEERLLTPEHWVSSCESTTEFHIEFYDQVERSLRFLLVHNDGERPALLDFLLTSDLEKYFAPMDLSLAANSSISAAYGRLTAAIKYIMARVLTRLSSEEQSLSDLKARAEAAFEGLWRLLGEVDAELKERWQAYEAMLDVAFGSYDKVIDVYDREYRLDLAKHENSHRTAIKDCYMLSRIATGKADDDLTFGAASYTNILKLDYYLWRVNDDASAEMDLVPLVVICHLYEKIVRGSVPNQHDFYASMAPRAVLDALDSLRRE